MYADTPMKIWKKYIDFFFISWKHFYHQIGINILHYLGVFVLGFPLSFYWLSEVKWIRMLSHRPRLRLSGPRQFYPGAYVALITLLTNPVSTCTNVASAVWRDCNSFTKDWEIMPLAPPPSSPLGLGSLRRTNFSSPAPCVHLKNLTLRCQLLVSIAKGEWVIILGGGGKVYTTHFSEPPLGRNRRSVL